MKIRDYQDRCFKHINFEFTTVRSTLACLPTGTGKTRIAAEVAKSFLPKRTLFLAHRRELLFQAQETLFNACLLESDFEMGDLYADRATIKPVVLTMVQSLNSKDTGGIRRLRRFRPNDFGLVICDEAHRGVCDSYKVIFEHFYQNAEIKMLALTATPDRLDEESLGQICDTVAFNYEILSAINDGWLVEPWQQFVAIEGLDFSHIKTENGDLCGAQLAEVMEMERNLQGVADATLKVAGHRRTLVFTASVKQAEMLSNIFNRHRSGCADWVCGFTSDEKRRKLLKDYNEGRLQIMTNCNCLCLDCDTEILTSSGWVGMNDMAPNHRVANWRNGEVFFSNPLAITKRLREPGEPMITLETKNRSIRVTANHRIVYRHGPQWPWTIKHAIDMVGVKAMLPVSGVSEPQWFQIPLPIRYATKGLYYTNPDALSADDCKFIGYWLGDGSASLLQSGGIEYKLCQQSKDTRICREVRRIISSCGFDSIERSCKGPGRNATIWSLPRGTGGKSQRRSGLFRIEPYLNKNGSDFLWGLDVEHFDALISGYWMADGCRHKDNTEPPKNIRICGSRYGLLSHLQAIACTKGYRASILKVDNRGHDHWILSLTKREHHAMTKFTMQAEPGWKSEFVWCVTTDSGCIITRRNGKVTVLGNSEGFDSPMVEVVVQASPTKSRALYAQRCGRSLRPEPGLVDRYDSAQARIAAISESSKPMALILDFVGNSGRHKLVSVADLLGGEVSDEAKEQVVEDAKQSLVQIRISKALQEADKQIEREAREKRLMELSRKAKLVASATFSMKSVSPFDVFDISPVKIRGWDMGKMITEKERMFFLRQHIDVNGMSKAQRDQLRKTLFYRWKAKLASVKQCAFIKRFYPKQDTHNLTMKQASVMIEQLKSRNYQPIQEPV